MNISFFTRAKGGNPHCGDKCAYWRKDHKTFLCIVDGLGCGKYAEKAALEALQFIEANLGLDLDEALVQCDEAIVDTRGVAMALAEIDHQQELFRYCAVGNIRGMLISEGIRWLLSSNGIVGAGIKRPLVETLQLEHDDIVLLTTDGLREIIHFDSKILSSHVQGINKLDCIIRDLVTHWQQGDDDIGVLMYQHNSQK